MSRPNRKGEDVMTNIEIAEMLERNNIVRGYVYPYEGSRREYWFEHSPSNIANFIMKYEDAREIVLTDSMDSLILNTMGNFIDRCPDQELLQQILPYLIPMQMGEEEPKDFPVAADTEIQAFLEKGNEIKMEFIMPKEASKGEIEMGNNAREENFEYVELFEKPGLFTNSRIDCSTVPKGIYCYDLRGSDYDPGRISTIENSVRVNHAGTILTAEFLDIPKDGFLGISEKLEFTMEEMSLEEFCEEQGIAYDSGEQEIDAKNQSKRGMGIGGMHHE